MGLQEDINSLIQNEREDAAKEAEENRLEGTDASIAMLNGWLHGVEAALALLVTEIDDLKAQSDLED